MLARQLCDFSGDPVPVLPLDPRMLMHYLNHEETIIM